MCSDRSHYSPHGVAGLLRIVSYDQSKETFLKAGSVYIAQTNRELEEYTIVSFNEWGPRHLLKLSGVESREAAHELRGAQI
ncbi:MAG: ribosome maturation factor RimM [Thermodesulfobacteriota bacterium]